MLKNLTLFIFLTFFGLGNAKQTFIIKLKYNVLNYNVINNTKIGASKFIELFKEPENEEVINFLNLFPELHNSSAFKIFRNLSTNDSISVTRFGHTIPIPPFWACFLIQVDEDIEIYPFVERLNKYTNIVEYAHLNIREELLNVPNDPLLSNQESLIDPLNLAHINAEQAWDIETGKPWVKVGVFDNGIDSIHPDLQVLTGHGYYYYQNLPLASDWGTTSGTVYPHGTPVAGIIGAKRNNNLGIAGIAGGDGSDSTGVSIIDFKKPYVDNNPDFTAFRMASIVDAARSVGSYFDYGGDFYTNDADSNQFYYNDAKGYGIQIGNHSYRLITELPANISEGKVLPDINQTDVSIEECRLCREAWIFSMQNGVINVISRANADAGTTDFEEVDGMFPQNLPDNWAVSVGASGYDGNTIQPGVNQSNSEINTGFASLYGGNMDLIAPGSDSIVYTTNFVIPNNSTDTLLYTAFNGTSAAAPHVSGVVGLLLSLRNKACYSQQNLTLEDVEYILENSATDLNAPGYDDLSGWGRLDAKAALDMVASPTKQIIHPDSILETNFLIADTISIAYSQAFTNEQWGPYTQNFELEQDRQYKVVRHLVEIVYDISNYVLPTTTLIDAWANSSISNATEFLADTTHVQVPIGNTGGTQLGYQYDIYQQTPFAEVTQVNLGNQQAKVIGYYYEFIEEYFFDFTANSNDNSVTTTNAPVTQSQLNNIWYPSNPNENLRLPLSIYLEDINFTDFFTQPCDSINLLVDDSTFIYPTLNINNIDADAFTVYPNPVQNTFYLDNSNSSISKVLYLTDLNGKILQKVEVDLQSKKEISIAILPKGIYLLRDTISAKTHKILKL